jgi:sec-independent protein translocase protein TatA
MSFGPFEILLILVLILVLFGAGKLPKVMGDLGVGIRNFRKSLNTDDTVLSKQEEEYQKNQEEVKKIEHIKVASKAPSKKKVKTKA